MWESMLKTVGLAPIDAYIEARLSIGHMVADNELSTGHFKFRVDPQALSLIIMDNDGKTVWKSIHNKPFLSSTQGMDGIGSGDHGMFKIDEKDEHPTLLQTITRVAYGSEPKTVQIFGGLGTKLVLPTHLDYVLTFKETSPAELCFVAEIVRRDPSMLNYNRLIFSFSSRKEEDFYGFGEQFSHLSLKGQKVPILVREQGVGRGASSASTLLNSARNILSTDYLGGDHLTTYCAVPQCITSDNRCIFLEHSEYCSFDLREPDCVAIRLNANKMTGKLIVGSSMLDLITEYTKYSGRIKPLPSWVDEGVIAGIQGGKDKVKHILQQMQQFEIPVAAVWLQDWSGKRLQNTGRGEHLYRHWWNWESDETLYPDWPDFVKELKERNIRVLSNVNPCLMGAKPGAKRDLFSEASEAKYLVSDPSQNTYAVDSGPGFTAGLIDLTNPEACNWFKAVLKEQVWSTGVSGIMTDFAEYMPYNSQQAKLSSGEPPETFHNRFPEEWARLNQEVVSELELDDEVLYSCRSAFTHSPGYMNLMWTGDQAVTWDYHQGIKSAVIGMLSAGFSGFSVIHSDIGGFLTVDGGLPGARLSRTRELLYRWMELGACTAVFKTTEGLIPELNAQFYTDEDTYLQLAHMTKLYMALAPYKRHLLKEAYEKGWPLMRSMVLHYPEDPQVRQLSYQQFLVGASLLVAPTLSPSASFVKVYFPKDEQRNTSWRHIWSGRYFSSDGTFKSVDTPLGQPALFVKEPRDDDGLLNSLLEFANTHYQRQGGSAA